MPDLHTHMNIRVDELEVGDRYHDGESLVTVHHIEQLSNDKTTFKVERFVLGHVTYETVVLPNRLHINITR